MVLFHAKGGTAVTSGHVRMDMGSQLRQHRGGFNLAASYPSYKTKGIIIGEADPDGCAACPIPQYPANAYRNVPAYGAYEVAMMKLSLDLADRTGVDLKGVLTWAWMFNGMAYAQRLQDAGEAGVRAAPPHQHRGAAA